MIEIERLEAAYERVRDDLLAERTDAGHWVGELSTSALSTATAVSALAVVRRASTDRSVKKYDDLIAGGLRWLADHQNGDGGFGDTDKSHSNIATTMLVVAAFHLADEQAKQSERSREPMRISTGKGDSPACDSVRQRQDVCRADHDQLRPGRVM